MIRRFDASPIMGQPYKHRPGAYGIFWHKGHVLLTFQAGIHNEWQLPGGGVDKGESFTHALHREAFEETGWKVSVTRKITIFRRFVYMPDYEIYAEKICHIYEGIALWRLGEPSEVDHNAELLSPLDARLMLRDEAQARLI